MRMLSKHLRFPLPGTEAKDMGAVAACGGFVIEETSD